MNEKILIAEDEAPIRMGLEDLLGSEGYQVYSAANGVEALELYKKECPDLVLLDIMMPEVSGYDVAREIRKGDNRTLILMLTAKGQELDKVIGLELGADDYIVKPFGVQELLARVRSHLRRLNSRAESGGVSAVDKKEGSGLRSDFQFGPWKVSPARLVISGRDEVIEISMRELELLKYFASRAGEVLDRNSLLNEIWGIEYMGTTRTLDQHIAKLRKKVEPPELGVELIRTVHGVGYQYLPEGGRDKSQAE